MLPNINKIFSKPRMLFLKNYVEGYLIIQLSRCVARVRQESNATRKGATYPKDSQSSPMAPSC